MAITDKTMLLLEYCGRGWYLFPLQERSKLPATPNGFKDATNNWGQILEWHSENENYNWGLATGRIVVVDIDPKNGGSYTQLKFPRTLAVKTGSGGFHLYYRNYGLDIKNSASKLSKGVDIRGQGGYVVLPPSIHPNGTSYDWLNNHEPVEFPKEFIEILKKKTVFVGKGSVEFIYPEKIENGNRNDTLFRLACSLAYKGLSPESVLAAVSIENNKKCSPPLEDEEIETIVNSSLRYITE